MQEKAASFLPLSLFGPSDLLCMEPRYHNMLKLSIHWAEYYSIALKQKKEAMLY